TLTSGSPSCRPTSTSDRIPRIVRVMGAQVTVRRTAIAASRVRTQTGRRPAGGPRSAQKTSPAATTQERSRLRVVALPQRGAGPAADGGRPPGADRQPRLPPPPRVPRAHHGEGTPTGSRPVGGPVRRAARRGRHRAEPKPHDEP